MIEEGLLTDKIVVIAGGVPEIAEASARLLATRGAAGLMVCGRGAERGQALAAIVSAAGCPTHFLPGDLTRPQDCAAVITEAELVFGRIDVLVVGAGEVPYLPLEETTPEKLDQLLAAKVRAPFLLLQGAATLMQRTGMDGILIITIGGNGTDGPRTVAAAAGKGALAAMARGFAASFAGDGIRGVRTCHRRRADRCHGAAQCRRTRDRRPRRRRIVGCTRLDHVRDGDGCEGRAGAGCEGRHPTRLEPSIGNGADRPALGKHRLEPTLRDRPPRCRRRRRGRAGRGPRSRDSRPEASRIALRPAPAAIPDAADCAAPGPWSARCRQACRRRDGRRPPP